MKAGSRAGGQAGGHDGTAGHGTASAESYEPVFTGATRSRLEQLFTKYPTKQACLLPALWMVWKDELRALFKRPAGKRPAGKSH